MRLHEHEAADLFEKAGIAVPRRGVAETTEDALRIGEDLGYPLLVKAQVLVGGRGLAGGIRTVDSPDRMAEAADALLGSEIKGLAVRKVLVSDKVDISRELYLGITMDGFDGRPVIVVSTEGGVNIEETAGKHPEKIAAVHADPGASFQPYEARNLLRKVGIAGKLLVACADVVVKLYRVFTRYEALIAEINPLVVTAQGGVAAVDAVLEIDDSAASGLGEAAPDRLSRYENPIERKGREIGVTYVDLDGDIGLISSGAGLGMASMDIIGRRMKPANFLETGGGITEKLLYQCMELLMMKRGLRGIFINIYGGINPIHEGARGVVRYMEEHGLGIPVVAKALGNLQEETWEIFRSGGVHVVTEAATEKAVDRLFEILSNNAR
ncbi:MAG: acetate--CoA ligase family protein [Deltaproteobacteria bacterium]|nr:acetate--CoA ligase family protein [Deltaproteobacteria bacterium]